MCNLSSMKGGHFGKHNGHPHPTDRILHRMHVGCKQDAGITFLEMPVFNLFSVIPCGYEEGKIIIQTGLCAQ